MRHYLAYDTSDKVIWGWGDTPASAMADAQDWYRRNGDDDEPWAELVRRLDTDLATRELVETVKVCGGQVAWTWSGTPADRVMIEA